MTENYINVIKEAQRPLVYERNIQPDCEIMEASTLVMDEDTEDGDTEQMGPEKEELGKNSFGSKMDRIRPEKVPRQRVQKLWRNVRWAEAFPDDSLSMDSADITTEFALRKVALLFETKKFGECASLIRRLNCVTLGNILHEVPIDVLHDSLPQSLNILEALYVKLYETTENPADFPREELQVDQLLQKLVAMFAKQSGMNNKHEKNSNSVYPSCRSILRVVIWIEPNVRKFVRLRKRALDKCLRHLGRHGLVESSEGGLMNLHDAFKIEFEKVVTQYRNSLQKLDELHMTAKHPVGSSVTFGPAPSSLSHHRMLQITRDDVQERIIKNRTLYNLSEPAVSNQYLRKFIHVLEKRIEYDKIVLFHDTELRKMGRSADEEQKCLSNSLREFSQGYASVLQLLKEVADEENVTDDDDDVFGEVSSDEETISPHTYRDKLRSLSSMNGILPHKTTGGSTSRRFRNFKGRSFTEGTRPSIIPLGQTFRQGNINGITNGLMSHHFPTTGSFPARIGKMFTVSEDQKKVEEELEGIRAQLEKSQEMVKHLQHREREYQLQIAQLQSALPTRVSESERVSELIGNYARLYTEDREMALQSLNALTDLKDVHSLKGKILFSVVVLSFRSAQQMVQEVRGRVRHILKLPVTSTTSDPDAMEMESHVEEYLSRCCHGFDLSQCIQEVSQQIYATLYDYPCLKSCDGLKIYIDSCVRLSWQLSVQQPPYVIVYDSRVFQADIHTRTDTSNDQSMLIQNYLWPTLIQANKGPCVRKGLVET